MIYKHYFKYKTIIYYKIKDTNLKPIKIFLEKRNSSPKSMLQKQLKALKLNLL